MGKLFLSMVVAFPDGIVPEDFAPRNLEHERFVSHVLTPPEKCTPHWMDYCCNNPATTTIPSTCYLWNGALWSGIEPANPVNSVCGRNLCFPCDIWITIANIKDKEFYIGKDKNNFDEAVQICANEGGKLF